MGWDGKPFSSFLEAVKPASCSWLTIPKQGVRCPPSPQPTFWKQHTQWCHQGSLWSHLDHVVISTLMVSTETFDSSSAPEQDLLLSFLFFCLSVLVGIPREFTWNVLSLLLNAWCLVGGSLQGSLGRAQHLLLIFVSSNSWALSKAS